MSRFVEVLNNYRNNIGIETFRKILDDLKITLDSEESHIEITFPYFLENMPQYPNFLPLWTMNAHFMAHHLKKIKILSSVSKSL